MQKTSKLTTIILWVLMAISVVLFVIMVGSIDDDSNPGTKAVQMITLNINWALIMFLCATAITLFFAVFQIVTNKAKALNALGALGIFAVILVISYILASGSIPTFYGVQKFVADGTLTETISKWVGTGLYLTYILFGGAILSIVGFGAASIFKR